MREIEEQSLEEQNKWHPLIIGVNHSIIGISKGLHTLIGIVLTMNTAWFTWNRESGHNPAICIEHIARNGATDAINGGTNEIVGSNQKTTDEAKRGWRAIVQFEERRIDIRFGATVADLWRRKKMKLKKMVKKDNRII